MTLRLPSLVRRNDGSAAVEFAFGVPILLMMVFGMLQLGLVMQANAGVQHALGEAARQATIFPTPSDTELQTTITNAKFGTGAGTWTTPTIQNGAGTKTITVTYTQPLDWIFFTTNATITKSKVIYLSD